jgi:hypothetical protein
VDEAAAASRIEELRALCEAAEAEVRQWQDEARNLSLAAAQARAANQGKGRGLGGLLLGAGYRRAARRSAASSNARIAAEVAEKRVAIAVGKRQAQAKVRGIKAAIAAAKIELRKAKAARRDSSRVQRQILADSEGDLSLLAKLAEERDAGNLSQGQFEAKRRQVLRAHFKPRR